VAYAYSINSAAYFPPDDMWGWGNFNYLETQQFVFPADAAGSTEIFLSFRGTACGSDSVVDPAPAYYATWQGGSTSIIPSVEGGNDNHVIIDYAAYLQGGASGQSVDSKRSAGDPLYVTVFPCLDAQCESIDEGRAIAVLISFRQTQADETSACEGSFDGGTGAGYDCCYVSKSIAADATQSEIDDAVSVSTFGGNTPSQSCIQKPQMQCLDEHHLIVGKDANAGDVRFIQLKGSLVPFIDDSARKHGQGLRVVLGDRVTVSMALSTTYIEYTVAASAQDKCNSMCSEAGGFPSETQRLASRCTLEAVSSFTAENGGAISVAGFGRIDGYSFMQGSYFSSSPGYSHTDDVTPGHDCPSCNRFCPLTPYAQGMHQLASCCYDVAQACTSSFAKEAGDARFHIDSGLLELSSSCRTATFAVDVAEVTVSNPLKRGDGSVMIQSPGHFVRSAACLNGTLAEQRAACSGPNLPSRTYALKYMGAWHDASDGPSVKSEQSQLLFSYVQNGDDCLKPYSGSLVRDSTLIHGGVGGSITPCTYNLLGYTPGCHDTTTLNTHIVRTIDPGAGYDNRGGLIASRYCAGKSTLMWTNMPSTANFSNNVIDGVVVETLGSTNAAGRAIAIVVDAPQDNAPVYFCAPEYDPLTLEFPEGAFVLRNWKVGTPLSSTLPGAGVLVSGETSYYGDNMESLGSFADGAIDARGLSVSMGDGLGCGLAGEYYPCAYVEGDSQQTSCYLKQTSATSAQTFSSLNGGSGPCQSWSMAATVSCPDALDGVGAAICPVIFPHGAEVPPTFVPSEATSTLLV
jgi:hypothetical protein